MGIVFVSILKSPSYCFSLHSTHIGSLSRFTNTGYAVLVRTRHLTERQQQNVYFARNQVKREKLHEAQSLYAGGERGDWVQHNRTLTQLHLQPSITQLKKGRYVSLWKANRGRTFKWQHEIQINCCGVAICWFEEGNPICIGIFFFFRRTA